jgi:pyochelin biosynthetic protein PchC
MTEKEVTVSLVADEVNPWIRRFHPLPEGDVRLFCFPHAGGSASYYFPLSAMLQPGIETLAVQYPGRQERRLEKCIDNIPELADRLYEAMASWTGRPFAFFGHSMGATLAFEVARRFGQRTGAGPLWLFASGRRAPSRRYQGEPGEPVHLRDDVGILAELRRAGGTDQRILADEELRAVILPMTRNDYKAIETYSYDPGPRLDCPITALVGDSDPQVTMDEAAAWSEHSAGGFDLRAFPGGHFYLEARRVDVAATISATLKKAHAASIH